MDIEKDLTKQKVYKDCNGNMLVTQENNLFKESLETHYLPTVTVGTTSRVSVLVLTPSQSSTYSRGWGVLRSWLSWERCC